MNTKIPIYKQITSLIPANLLRNIVSKHKANKYKKGITFTSYFNTLIFGQICNTQSLRDITHILRGVGGLSQLMGIQKVPCKSSISYFNANTPWQIFKEIYFDLLAHHSNYLKIPSRQLKLKKKLIILDSSVVTLCLSIFDWAKYTTKKGAIRLHTGLDYETLMPEYLEITDGKGAEPKALFLSKFNKDTALIADRGYADTKLYKVWDDAKIDFIVRSQGPEYIKSEAVGELDLPDDSPSSIIKDEIMKYSGQGAKKQYSKEIRRVTVYNADSDETLSLMTNNFTWTAETVSELYRARWSIEEFFKELKQGLSVKSFLGTSANAVMIQIWCAMIVLLLLRIIKRQTKGKWYMSNLITFIRMILFKHYNLIELLNTVGKDPPKKIKNGIIEGQTTLFYNL